MAKRKGKRPRPKKAAEIVDVPSALAAVETNLGVHGKSAGGKTSNKRTRAIGDTEASENVNSLHLITQEVQPTKNAKRTRRATLKSQLTAEQPSAEVLTTSSALTALAQPLESMPEEPAAKSDVSAIPDQEPTARAETHVTTTAAAEAIATKQDTATEVVSNHAQQHVDAASTTVPAPAKNSTPTPSAASVAIAPAQLPHPMMFVPAELIKNPNSLPLWVSMQPEMEQMKRAYTTATPLTLVGLALMWQDALKMSIPQHMAPTPLNTQFAQAGNANTGVEQQSQTTVAPKMQAVQAAVAEPEAKQQIQPATPQPTPAPKVVDPEQEKQVRESLRQLQGFTSTKPHESLKSNVHGDSSGADAPEVTLSAEQSAVVDAVVNLRRSVCITGPAGTGKSFLLKHIIDLLRTKYGDGVAVTAPTGIAAIPLQVDMLTSQYLWNNGQTIHSFAGIGMGDGPIDMIVDTATNHFPTVKRWLRTEVLIIDEASMLSADLLDKIEQIPRVIRRNNLPFGGIQVILCGDFFQLPPVRVNSVGFCFESKRWAACIQEVFELTEVHRQKGDDKFIKILNEIRNGQVSNDTEKMLKAQEKELEITDGILPTQLFCVNKDVDHINSTKLSELKTQSRNYSSRDSDRDYRVRDFLNKNVQAPEELLLKIGAQVMLLKNDPIYPLVNGSRGVVVGFSEEARKHFAPVVQFANGTKMTVTPQKFECYFKDYGHVSRTQVPLKLAWAISIHKAQGMTLDRVECDVSKAFDCGQVYVALSRCRALEGMCLKGFSARKVKVHDKVAKFYEDLRLQVQQRRAETSDHTKPDDPFVVKFS